MFGGTGMGFFAALLYWFPKMFAKPLMRKLRCFHGFPVYRFQYAVFQHAGPRLHGYAEAVLHSSAPISLWACHCVDRWIHSSDRACHVFANLIVALFKGKKAEQNHGEE